MNENISSAGLRLNESKPLLRIEPLYSTGMHDMTFQEQVIEHRNVQRPLEVIDILERKLSARSARNAQKQSRSAKTRQSQTRAHGSQDKWQVKLSCELTIARSQNFLPIASLMVAGSVNVLPGA